MTAKDLQIENAEIEYECFLDELDAQALLENDVVLHKQRREIIMKTLLVSLCLFVAVLSASGCAMSDAERAYRERTGIGTCGAKEKSTDVLTAIGAWGSRSNPVQAVQASQDRHPWCR